MLEEFRVDFFFQAEDGIRDHCVTGVQTCALPISIDVTADPTNKYYDCSAVLTRFSPLTCTKVSGLYAKLLLQ